MSNLEIRDTLRVFLRDRISCYDELQLLLFMRSRAAEWLDSDTISQHLMISRETVELSFQHLRRTDLIAAEQVHEVVLYRYAPAQPSTAALMDEVAQMCASRPLDLVKVMTANALERLRDSSVGPWGQVLAARDKGRRTSQ